MVQSQSLHCSVSAVQCSIDPLSDHRGRPFCSLQVEPAKSTNFAQLVSSFIMGVKGCPQLESGKSGHYYLDSKRMKKDEVAAQQEIYLYEFVEMVKSSHETMAVLPQMLKVLERDPGLSKYCQSKPKVVPKCEQVLEFGEG